MIRVIEYCCPVSRLLASIIPRVLPCRKAALEESPKELITCPVTACKREATKFRYVKSYRGKFTQLDVGTS